MWWFALVQTVKSDFRVVHSLQLAKTIYEFRFPKSSAPSVANDVIPRILSIEERNWLMAFSQYDISNNVGISNRRSEIGLVWSPYPVGGNFGDWLSPYIFKQLTDRPIRYYDYSLTAFEKNVLGIGSILHECGKESLVFGTGIQSLNTIRSLPKRIFLVRGPHTRDEILRAGGACPKLYGDPVFLLQNMYRPRIDEFGLSEKYIFAPHVNQLNLNVQLPENVEVLNLRVAKSNDIEATINKLTMAKGVLTSSLHAYAICLTFGIPARLIEFSHTFSKIPGDGIKFRDLVEGADLTFEPPLRLGLDWRDVNIKKLMQERRVKESVSGRIKEAFVELIDFWDSI